MVEQSRGEDWDEIRERELRRRNVVLYRVNEHNEERASGTERMAWDREAFLEICGLPDLGLEGEDIRFCRRVGPWEREEREQGR